MDANPKKARDVFLAAIKLPAEERQAYLQGTCGDDLALHQRVAVLVQAQAEIGTFQEAPAPTLDQPRSEFPSSVIGSYTLVEEIGEGGMGSVWIAQQTEPVKRLVAVKLIKTGMESAQVIARFEAERQALALMDHPHIAKVLDGGVTPFGRPYFVMELVRGSSITAYCDEHHLTTRQRLELFISICQAIQHAHQKGIIHRDLKPANVLVALYDGEPVPKVIDFGVAKAVGQRLTDRTMVTDVGNIVGTLEYMSPEQAELNNQDIDTRSDIYSLGVLLYELLAGSPPFTRRELEKSGMLEMLRVIREQEPARPSTRLSTAKGLPTLASNRGTEAAKLTRLMRGELDWIVMKCLEKDRSRRYETANGLALDIKRYLRGEPVQAGPPSAWYRLRKFAGRNRRGLATAVLVGMIVLAAIGSVAGFLGWEARDQQARQAKIQDEVENALREANAHLERALTLADDPSAWKVALDAAFAALRPAQTLLASHGDLLERPLQEDVQALAALLATAEKDRALAAAVERIRLRRSEPTLVRASKLASDAAGKYRQVFADYGVVAEVTPPQDVANLLVGKHPAVRAALLSAFDDWALASTLLPGGKSFRHWLGAVFAQADPDSWRSQILPALNDRPALQALAKRPEALKQPLSAVILLANSLRHQGDNETALELLRAMQSRHPGEFWVNWFLAHALVETRPPELEDAISFFRVAVALRPRNAFAHHSLGYALQEKKAYAAALKAYEMVLELEPTYPLTHLNIGGILLEQEDVPGAIAKFKEAIACDPEFAPAYCNLAVALKHQGQFMEAMKCLDKALALTPNDALSHVNVGQILDHLNKPQEAIAAYKKAVACDPECAAAYDALGAALTDEGDFAGALAQHKKAIALDPEHPRYHYNHGRALYQSKDFSGATDAFAKACQLKPKWPEAHYNLGTARLDLKELDSAIVAFRKAIDLKPNYAEAYGNLGVALSSKGDVGAAVKAFQKALDLDPNLPLAEAHFYLGNARKQKGDLPGATAAYKQAIKLHDRFAAAHNNLGQVLQTQNDWPGAEEAYRKAVASDPTLAAAHSNLGGALVHLNQPVEAEHFLRLALKLQPNYPEAVSNLGLALIKQNKFKAAEAAYRKAIELGLDDYIVRFGLGRALLGQDKYAAAEKEFRQAVTWQPGLVAGHLLLGNALGMQKKLDDAIAAYRQALKLQPNLASAKRNLAASLKDKAWRLVVPANVLPADAAAGVQMVQEGLALDPQCKILWSTLGVAHYRAGAWKEAAVALEKSFELNNRGLIQDWVFVAMAKWQLGEKEEARKWYDRAAKWMETNPATAELRGFRDEAVKLLESTEKND